MDLSKGLGGKDYAERDAAFGSNYKEAPIPTGRLYFKEKQVFVNFS
jgi:hypothetical protein